LKEEEGEENVEMKSACSAKNVGLNFLKLVCFVPIDIERVIVLYVRFCIICIILTTSFRTVFGRVRIVTEVAYWLLHVLLSACITAAPTERMSVKFDIGYFMKVFRNYKVG
jgi:hypothetical protein